MQGVGFRHLPGITGTEPQASSRLFPIFAERVMSSRRPDRQASLEALGLGLDAAPFEVLQRSGGRRVGDTVELVPAPRADPDGRLSVDLLVHGVRHMPEPAQQRITSLRTGESLQLTSEPSNPVEARALLVTDRDEVRLGHVPSPLLDLVHRMSSPAVTVVRANGPEVGFPLRLLVNLTGLLPAGEQPFDGPAWQTT